MEIYKVMPAVMRDVEAIGKDKQNDFHKYRFRGIDDALNVVGAACRKHNVTTSWSVQDVEYTDGHGKSGKDVRCTLIGTIKFFAADGSSVESSAAGLGIDNLDKASNKAQSSALKYALFNGLLIPVEAGVLDDADDERLQREAERNHTPIQHSAKQKKHNLPAESEWDSMTADQLLATARRAEEAGYRKSDVYMQRLIAKGKAKREEEKANVQ